jgi:ParB family chromosome partitioning protein
MNNFRATTLFDVDVIRIDPRLREVDQSSVDRLVESIRRIGLKTPITVRMSDPDDVGAFPILVAGLHRLKAAQALGWEKIACFVSDDADADHARLWEIAENLHRAELTVLERSEHVSEWIRLADKVAQVAPPSGGVQPLDRGIRKAVRELGIERTDAQRAVKVDSLTREAKEAARRVGLDDNQSALLSASKAAPERQAAVVRELAEAKATKIDGDIRNRAAREVAEWIVAHADGNDLDAVKANLFAAGAKTIAHELVNLIGESIMDRRFGT